MRDMSFCNNLLLLVIITDEGVRSMISIPGSPLCQVGDDVIRPGKI